MAKPWEKETYDFTKSGKKKAKKKKGKTLNELDSEQPSATDAWKLARDRKKRQKKLAPYAKTGPGA
jgi:hypothetical protein